VIGQTISHYRILAKIGQDTTGALYKATDTDSGRLVTLKVLSSGAAANPGLRAVLERLQHPNIARIYEVSRSGDVDFAVMEAAEGESAYDFLERERFAFMVPKKIPERERDCQLANCNVCATMMSANRASVPIALA